MILQVLLVFFALFGWLPVAIADDVVIASCAINPNIYMDHDIPSKFSASNSMIRKSNSLYGSKGKRMVIEGRVFDMNCVPIANAVVRIWQLNYKGMDQRTVDDHDFLLDVGGSLSPVKVVDMYDPNFIDTATATTDNLGYYRFITVVPGAQSGRAPYVNFTVNQPEILPFSTLMFFNDITVVNKKSNVRFSYANDPVAQHYPKNVSALMVADYRGDDSDGMRHYHFNITLPGAQVYKKY